MNVLIKTEAAREIISIESVLHKDPGRKITAQSALTHDVDLFRAVKLMQTLAQIVKRNMDKALCVSAHIFHQGSGVEQNHVRVMAKRVDILIMEMLHDAVFYVVDDKACHIDGILCGGIRRCIREVEIL